MYIIVIIISRTILRKKKEVKRKTKFKIFNIKRYMRYIKVIYNKKVLLVIIIVSIVSNIYTMYLNDKYQTLYIDNKEYEKVICVVKSKIEHEYLNKYIVQIISIENETKYKGTQVYIEISKYNKQEENFEYGDEIELTGIFKKANVDRNYFGFSYFEYLKQIQIYGTIEVSKVTNILYNEDNSLLGEIYNLNEELSQNIEKMLSEQTSSIVNGLVLGGNSSIDEELQENFKRVNISHILAISGMHISYLIMGITWLTNKLIGRNKGIYIVIIFILMYILITGFSPSIIRAGVTAIILLISKKVYKQNDIFNSLALTLLGMLIYNPFLMQNIGLQFSYIGTIGIIVFNKKIKYLISLVEKKSKIMKQLDRSSLKIQNNVYAKIKEIIVSIISVQIVILPLVILHFNIVPIYFLISNILISFIIGIVIILSFLTVFLSLISMQVAGFFAVYLELGITCIIQISEISQLPLSIIYVKTPNIVSVIIYYIILLVICCVYNICINEKSNHTTNRIKNSFLHLKIKYREKYKKQIKKEINENKLKYIIYLMLIIGIYTVISISTKTLNIYFVDVGQGDCTFITTPNNKTILIDGGGSNLDFDIGKNILLPYILDRGYTKIDYIFISHFDSDHVKGILTIVEELKVNKIFISKQIETTDNYTKLLEITKEKEVEIIELEKGDSIIIDEKIEIDILWPGEKQIENNILNNNSLVFRLEYKEFSMIFTGDIEEIAEREIVEDVFNIELEADILKVAHHGSKTSSIQKFLELTNPKIAIIGVGKGNMFNHPSIEVLERLESLNCDIYRTDENGEISITVDNKSNIKIKTHIRNN